MQGGVSCGNPILPGIFVNLEHSEVISFVLGKIKGIKQPKLKIRFSQIFQLMYFIPDWENTDHTNCFYK